MTGSMRTREVRSRGWMNDSWQLLGFSDGGEKEGDGLTGGNRPDYSRCLLEVSASLYGSDGSYREDLAGGYSMILR